MSTGAIPPLPAGYQLEQSSIPPLPAGYKLETAQPSQGPAPETHEGFLSAVGSDLAGAAKGIAMAGPVGIAYQSLKHAYDNFQSVKATGKTLEQQQSESEKGAGYNPVYRALAPAAQAVGANVPAMEQDAAKGDTAGVLGHAAVPTALAMSPLALEGAARFAGKVSEAIPSKMRAAEGFQDVMSKAKNQPVSLPNSQDAILDMIDWQKKTQLGPTINKFLNRVTNPKMGPLTYEEARDFYQLLGRLSADETSRLAPAIRADLSRMVHNFKADVGNAAASVGKGAEYYDAMNEFSRASSLEDAIGVLKKHAATGFLKLLQGTAIGAGTAAGYSLYKDLEK